MSEGGAARKPGRPPQIDRDQILAAVSASPNVDTLTMRELATQLGVRHGALYRWVANRDSLFDLIGENVVEHVVSEAAVAVGDWRTRLTVLLRALHAEFRSVPGYATHLSRPHSHDAHSAGRLRRAVVDILLDGNVTPPLAEESWYILITTVVGWSAFEEQPHELGSEVPSFDAFLDVILRGLPVRDLPD